MSNFEFMKQQRIIDDYSAFNKMYQYLVFAEKNFYFNHQLCGMNVRWALEQFCCLVTDLKEIKYDTKPTYMGQFLSSENRLKLLLAVNGEVNYRTICEINSISREYAHSITPPNEDLYGEMLPKMYGLIVWLYEVLLGIKLGLTYGGFSYDKIAQDEDILFVKKEDVVYTSKEQVERIRRKFPNCDTSLLYSIRKNDEKFELLDENDNVVETYINEEFITVDDDLLLENASLLAVQEQLRHTLKMQESEKKKLEEKVGSLSYEIEQAEKRIINLQENFKAQTDAYKVLVQLKNVLVQEKKNLEEKLFKVQSEYKNLNAVLQEEIISFKEDRVQLQTLLSNAEAQVVYYRALVKKYTSKMKENTSLVLSNIERFQKGYQVYQRTKDENEFRKVLLGIRYVIDGVREEVKQEKLQREREKVETDNKIKHVEWMVKKNNAVWVILISILCIIALCLVGIVGYLIQNRETEYKQTSQIVVMNPQEQNLEEERGGTIDIQKENFSGGDVISEHEEEQLIQSPDDRLDMLYSESKEKLPRTIAEVEDVNTVFLKEYLMFIENLEVFYELARWGEESDAYTIVSKKYVPFYEDLRDFFERRIYTIANSEEIEYVYMRYSAYSSGTMYGMAVAPEAVSARLSYQSTKEDIMDVFGAEYCKQKSYDMGYIIPELENTSGIIVYVKLEDCEIYVFMDETGNQIVDYIYILGEK